MKRIRAFWYILKNTFTSPAYYADILKAPFSLSLKFFYTFFVFYSLIFTVYITIEFILPLGDFLKFLPEKLVNIYPSELEVTIEGGHASTNVSEPYRIPLEEIKNIFEDEQDRVLGENTEEIKNLIVIDTAGKIENFSEYQTYSLLTKDYISYINDSGNVETVSLSDVGDVAINRGVVEDFVGVITPFLKWVVPILVVASFLLTLGFYPASKLFYLLFFSLVLIVVGKLMSFQISYKKCLQLGLHLIVIPTTIFSAFDLAGFPIAIPFLQTIILTILGVFVLRKIKHLQALPAPVAKK